MSFGVGISDVLKVLQLARDTVQSCRAAPALFAEASRACQSLISLLEAVEIEYRKPESLLHYDERARMDFKNHFRDCQKSMQPLADYILKYASLGTSKIKLTDRVMFSKKTYVELRQNLVFYTAQLSDFFQTIGMSALGRIEQKVGDVKESVLDKLDQMCAEMRIMGDKESLLSEHPDDSKHVWKAFRSELIKAGYNSAVLQQYQAEIFLRIRELMNCGVLESDDAPSYRTEEEPLQKEQEVYRMPRRSRTATQSSDSDEEFYKTPKRQRSRADLRSRKSNESIKSPKDNMADLEETISYPNSRDNERTRPNDDTSGPMRRRQTAPDVQLSTRGNPARTQSPQAMKEELNAPPEYGKEEWSIRRSEDPVRRSERRRDYDEDGEVVEIRRRVKPEILVGQRTKPAIPWYYRSKDEVQPKSYNTGNIRSDSLPTAAAAGRLDKVKSLLRSGSNIEATGPQSWTETNTTYDSEGVAHTTETRHSYPETTALYRSAFAGHIKVAHYLLIHGANVNTRDGYDGRPGELILYKAIRNSNSEIVHLLLEYDAWQSLYGTTGRSTTGRVTALQVACKYPKRAIVRLLLDYGADIDVCTPGSAETPLYIASLNGFGGIVEMLVQEGAIVNTLNCDGASPLYKASGRGHAGAVRHLLTYGADPSLARGRQGETALYKAAWENHMDVVDHLLEFEADVNIRNDKKMRRYKDGMQKFVHGVVAGLSKDHAFMNSWSKMPLHAAAYQGNRQMVELLVEAGAELEAMGKDEMTPLYLAAQQGHKSTVKALLKAGAQLETEKHDPVLAIINETNKNKKAVGTNGRGLTVLDEHRNRMERAGTGDFLVGLVAQVVGGMAKTRRGTL